MRPSTWFMAITLALAGCGTGSIVESDLCTLEASLNITEGFAGDVVIATARPLTTQPDTIVRVGGTDADILAVDRTDCLLCDACIENAECTGCETSCSDCDALCSECIQTVTFEVPAISGGDHSVVIQNRYGASDPLPFLVLDGDSSDTGYTGNRRRKRHSGFRPPFTPRRH